MRIRPATQDDAPGLARIQVDSYRTAYAGILPADYLAQFSYEEQEQDWRTLLATEPETVLLVAEEDASLAGYALGARLENQSYDCELVALHVRRDQQGQGIGRSLIGAIAWQYAAQGCRSLVLWTLEANRPARELYERLGGQLVDRQQFELDEKTAFMEIAYVWSPMSNLLVSLQDN
jgi:GNAT superfamily N-acetyltransferase